MFNIEKVSAHCDIPCGVYDPGEAQYAALSVIRFIDLINEMPDSNSFDKDNLAKFTRLVEQKEEHSIIAKNAVAVIWGDYFKAPQIEKHPGVHDLVHSIMMDGSKCKQGLHREDGLSLLSKINEFAEMFWATKEVETEKKISPYAPNLEVVVPVLKSA
jgi:nickel superoxide dismutase|tara:strand:+ start:974 stop:1447 length:474 start_codon:yes stop_codon:yes gene_type:complete